MSIQGMTDIYGNKQDFFERLIESTIMIGQPSSQFSYLVSILDDYVSGFLQDRDRSQVYYSTPCFNICLFAVFFVFPGWIQCHWPSVVGFLPNLCSHFFKFNANIHYYTLNSDCILENILPVPFQLKGFLSTRINSFWMRYTWSLRKIDAWYSGGYYVASSQCLWMQPTTWIPQTKGLICV